MATKPRLTAVQRKSRKEVRGLIRDAREEARDCRASFLGDTARLLDDLADIAEKYLKGLKCQQK